METEKTHICPWWMGYFLINPLRKTGQNPGKILSEFVKPGMQVMDYGCAMGYFSIPMAKMTGRNGKVVCVDIQQRMLDKLEKRAKRAKLEHTILTRRTGIHDSFEELRSQIDFALLFAVVHEVPDKKDLFTRLYNILKPGGKILFAEPSGHVFPAEFEKSVSIAESAGFIRSGERTIYRSHSLVLEKT